MKKKYFFCVGVMWLCCSASFIDRSYFLHPPSYFPEPVYELSNRHLVAEKIDLGRVLFYDPLLSKDGTISCASCHSPYNAFAHTDHALSHGIHDSIGTRNAPPLFNLAWQSSFMWDGAINHLDMQALAPISHRSEMGESLVHVVEKLQGEKLYRTMFKKAFGDSLITGQRTLKALSQFQLTLVSANSKYDQMRREELIFSQQEEKGYKLFQIHCQSCHQEPLFSTYEFANNGLPVDTFLQDEGKWSITGQPSDSLLFKIPSLRNLKYTHPYMHDGRFRKLREVIEHYTSGIAHSLTLDERLKMPIELSPHDRIDLIAFLMTLDDPNFVFDPKHQYPRNLLK